MFLSDFENSSHNFSKICKLLENDYGVDIKPYVVMDSQSLTNQIYNLESQKSKIVLEHDFGSYLLDPEYNKTVYLVEALKVILKEIAPKRMKRKVSESNIKMDEDIQMSDKKDVNGMSQLLEQMLMEDGELERAEIVLATKDVVSRLQKMIEDLGKMGTDDLMPLVDGIRAQFGAQTAENFSSITEQRIQSAADSIQEMKDTMDQFAQQFEGKISDEDVQTVPVNDMSAPEGEMADMGDEPNVADDNDLSALGDLGSMGGEDANAQMEPLGRAKKESVENSNSALNENFKIITMNGKRVRVTNEQYSILVKAKLITERVKSFGGMVSVPSLGTVNTTVLSIGGKSFKLNESQIQALLFAKNFVKIVENKKAKSVQLNESQSQKLVNAKLLMNKINEIIKKG